MLVGGAPRDLFRDREPRDFDVVTDADLTQIRQLFRNSRTVGKRFPIVHTYFGRELVEISSFKTEHAGSKAEMVTADAAERDFTVNAIYYDLDDFKVYDPLNGLRDLERGRVVAIGDVYRKFEEDPVRMLRALKLVVKQGLVLESRLAKAIAACCKKTEELGEGRRYEEITRIFLEAEAPAYVAQCRKYGLLEGMWPNGEALALKNGLEFFDGLSTDLPIHYSRGSYSKTTHTHLWLKLFLASGHFEPTTDAGAIKGQWERFIDPLAMPFRAPILEALNLISILSGAKRRKLPEAKREIRSLVAHWAQREAPDLWARLDRIWLEAPQRMGREHSVDVRPADKKPKRKRRRRRRRRNPD